MTSHRLNIFGPAGSYTYDIHQGNSIIGRQATIIVELQR